MPYKLVDALDDTVHESLRDGVEQRVIPRHWTIDGVDLAIDLTDENYAKFLEAQQYWIGLSQPVVQSVNGHTPALEQAQAAPAALPPSPEPEPEPVAEAPTEPIAATTVAEAKPTLPKLPGSIRKALQDHHTKLSKPQRRAVADWYRAKYPTERHRSPAYNWSKGALDEFNGDYGLSA